MKRLHHECSALGLRPCPLTDNIGQLRAEAFRRFFPRCSDVHECDDAFVPAEPEQLRHVAIVGSPAGQPSARRSRAPGRRAAGCRRHSRPTIPVPARASSDDWARRVRPRDDQRRETEAIAILLHHRGRHGRVVAKVDFGECFAEPCACFAADQQQPPRRELAVVGHADRRGQQAVELCGSSVRARRAGATAASAGLRENRENSCPLRVSFQTAKHNS